MITALRMLFTRWTPWEQSIQAAILSASPISTQQILAAQFDSINKVQRIVKWSEIDFYVMREGKVNWSDIPTFTNKDDFLLAKTVTETPLKAIHTYVHCTKGHIFSFESDYPIRPFAFANFPVRLLELNSPGLA